MLTAVARLGATVSDSADWNEWRKKIWHLLLLLGAAYSQYNPKFAWATVVLVAAASMSEPPSMKTSVPQQLLQNRRLIIARPSRTIEREDGSWRDEYGPEHSPVDVEQLTSAVKELTDTLRGKSGEAK